MSDSKSCLVHPQWVDFDHDLGAKPIYSTTEAKKSDEYKASFRQPINDDDTPSVEIDFDSMTTEDDDCHGDINSNDNKTNPKQPNHCNSQDFVNNIHRHNFSRLVREVLKAEEALLNSGLSLSSSCSFDPHPIKQQKKSVKKELKTNTQTPSSPSRTNSPRFCKNNDRDLTILRQETALLKVRQAKRTISCKCAMGIAQALSQFERAVYKNERRDKADSGDQFEPAYSLAVDPTQRRKEMQIVQEQQFHEYHHQQKLRQQQTPTTRQKRKLPEEYHHTNQPDVITILTLARSLLHFWRHSLQPKDRISAPDYLDEYQPNDEHIGWVKLFDAVVIEVARYENNVSPSKVGLGDSSIDMKKMHVLKEGELAIHVHFLHYPSSHDQWVLLADEKHGEDNIKGEEARGMLIVPIRSHRESLLSIGIVESDVESDSDNFSESSNERPKCSSGRSGRSGRSGGMGKKRSLTTISNNDFDDGNNEASPSSKSTGRRRKQTTILQAFNNGKNDASSSADRRRKRTIYNTKTSNNSSPKGFVRRNRQSWNEEEDKIIVQGVISEIRKDIKGNVIGEDEVRTNTLKPEFWRDLMTRHFNKRKRKIHSVKNRLKTLRKKTENGNLVSKMIHEDTESHIDASIPINEKNSSQNVMLLKKIGETQQIVENDSNGGQSSKKVGKHDGSDDNTVSTQKIRTTEHKTTEDDEEKLSMTWICTECCEAECITQPDSPLVVCEGICNRPFHYPCAGLASVPSADEKWVCRDCLDKRHQCVVCQEYGNDDEEVYNCGVKSCGLFYHEACLSMYDVDVKLSHHTISAPVNPTQNNEEDQLMDGDKNHEEKVISRPKFRCPAHYCWTCSGGVPPDPLLSSEFPCESQTVKKKRKKRENEVNNAFLQKKERLFRCLYCPNSYHISCIPPMSRFHELALICHEHVYTRKLPYLDANNSFQAKIEEAENEKLLTQQKTTSRSKDHLLTKLSKSSDVLNPFFQAMRGDRVPQFQKKITEVLSNSEKGWGEFNNESFCLPCDLQNEVHSKPPSYTHVHTNRYNPNSRPKREPPSAVCQCVFGKCDEHCLNRMVGTECIGNSDTKLGEKDPYWNCNCGLECGNRMLGRRRFAKCKPKHEQGKGWGLIAVNGVKKGGLVQEYVGEIIDEKTKRARLNLWAQEHPNDPNFYIMHLEPGWYIDARILGNLSRFINHSCEPNCKLAPLNVAGYTRVCIVSIRDIAPGEFLSYDYQFDSKDSEKFVCTCGSSICRGTLNGGSKDSKPEAIEEKQKTKREIWLEAKARLERDKIFLAEVENDSQKRLNQVSASLPGESENSLSTVANGPQPRLATECQDMQICLWRNVTLGSDLYSRHWKLLKSTRRNKTFPNYRRKTSKQRLPYIDVLSKIKGIPVIEKEQD